MLARFDVDRKACRARRIADILRGDDDDAAAIASSGATGSVLTTDIDLHRRPAGASLSGLGDPVTSFGAGNIILGGDGSDILEGRGGDDLIDGDTWLNVRISVRANTDGPAPRSPPSTA